MRRYLRCPGAICSPARRALRAVLQPHIRFCDKLIADALSPLPRGCGASSHLLAAADAPWAASRADAFRIASTVALACVTTLVFVRRREAASQHAVAAGGLSGRRRRARGARLALHGPKIEYAMLIRTRKATCGWIKTGGGRRVFRSLKWESDLGEKKRSDSCLNRQ